MSLRLYIPPKTEEDLLEIETALDGSFDKTEIVKMAIHNFKQQISSTNHFLVPKVSTWPSKKKSLDNQSWQSYFKHIDEILINKSITPAISNEQLDDLIYE
jgi:hypothetical protein